MKEYEKQIHRYLALNQLAADRGTVLFGGTEDQEIPVIELKQSFAFEENIYNRSFADVSIYEAVELFKACIEALNPESVILHIGEADLESFKADSVRFDRAYRNLITYIKKVNRKCILSVISLKNRQNTPEVAALNQHLKIIAESEQCFFSDINTEYVWNPREIREIISFVYSTGFVRSLKRTTPNYDLIKVLFCYEDQSREVQTAVYKADQPDVISIYSEKPASSML